MEEKIAVIDIVALAEKHVKHWETRHRRDGSEIQYPFWTVEELLGAMADFETAKNTAVEIRGVTPAWVMAVIVRLAYPNPIVFRKDAEHFAYTQRLRMAEKDEGINPEGGIEFAVETEGDRVFITYMADDINKPFTNGSHNYDMSRLPLVRTPYVQPDSHVYLSGSAAYPVSMSILPAYFDRCKSISIMDHDQPDYTCVATYCQERKIGDRLPGAHTG